MNLLRLLEGRINLPRFPVRDDPRDKMRPTPKLRGPFGTGRDVVAAEALDLTRTDVAGACPICGAPSPRPLASVYGHLVNECRACRAGFVWPLPSKTLLAQLYGPEYWDQYADAAVPLYERPGAVEHGLKHQAALLERLLDGQREARILDVGAGDGSMLRVLQDHGFRNAKGLEVDARNAERARSRLGVDVVQGDLSSCEEGGWDAVTLWAVIEHVVAPVETVRRAAELVRPGGLILLMTGDNASTAGAVQGGFDSWVYPPEHLYFFTRRSLHALLTAGGLRKVHVKLGYQRAPKEAVLWGLRTWDALRRRTRSRSTSWRSDVSNLLVAWGRRAHPIR